MKKRIYEIYKKCIYKLTYRFHIFYKLMYLNIEAGISLYFDPFVDGSWDK